MDKENGEGYLPVDPVISFPTSSFPNSDRGCLFALRPCHTFYVLCHKEIAFDNIRGLQL